MGRQINLFYCARSLFLWPQKEKREIAQRFLITFASHLMVLNVMCSHLAQFARRKISNLTKLWELRTKSKEFIFIWHAWDF
jgi:hypothetical protein